MASQSPIPEAGRAPIRRGILKKDDPAWAGRGREFGYHRWDRGDLAQVLRQVPARKNPEPGPATQAETSR